MNETEKEEIGNSFKLISKSLTRIMYLSILTIILSLVNVFFEGLPYQVWVIYAVIVLILTLRYFDKVCFLTDKIGKTLLQGSGNTPSEL